MNLISIITFAALTQVVESHYDELRQFVCTGPAGSLSLAEQVIYETWMRANRHDSPMPDNPRAYVFRRINRV